MIITKLHRNELGTVYGVLFLLALSGATLLAVTLCSCVTDPHGKYYVNGTGTVDQNGNPTGTVTGGVEVNFVKRPSPTPTPRPDLENFE